MPSTSSHRQSLTPYVPGAWPSTSRDQHDDTAQDADVSSVSSYAGSSRISWARKDGRKARRRWTYTGPVRPHNATIAPPGLTCSNLVSFSPTISNDLKLSPVTDATVSNLLLQYLQNLITISLRTYLQASTATSSPLNTPDLADWPTLLDTNRGSSTLLDPLMSSSPPPDPVPRFDHLTPSGSNLGMFYHYPPRFLNTAFKDRHFPSHHLDPPLLNFIPSLPPLRLPVHGSLTGYLFPDSPPAPPSPPSEARSTPPSFIIPPPTSGYSPSFPQPSCIATEFFPVTEDLQHSPRSIAALTLTDFHTLDADSPVLPPGCVAPTEGSDAVVSTPTPPPEMDAFALATAVASSTSPSSFSIPLSVQSNSPPIMMTTHTDGIDEPDLDAYRRPSGTTEASVGHHGYDDRVVFDHADAAEHTERVLVRRLSAPQPIVWQSPRPPTTRTISSRVDVGEENGPRRKKAIKQPVMGKVRKLGERLRGLFKSKADTPPKTRLGSSRATPEYNLMRTTTAITNVEYESVRFMFMRVGTLQILSRYRRRSTQYPHPVLVPRICGTIVGLYRYPPYFHRAPITSSRLYLSVPPPNVMLFNIRKALRPLNHMLSAQPATPRTSLPETMSPLARHELQGGDENALKLHHRPSKVNPNRLEQP